uniref:Uncharacterized protein n=1 Tax=Hyaloperonospora arabidopsidis (strain Emoy2) TaxID=559515 RepID=M4BGR2_HYAAE
MDCPTCALQYTTCAYTKSTIILKRALALHPPRTPSCSGSPPGEPLRLSANHTQFRKRFHNVPLVTGGFIKYHWYCFRYWSTAKPHRVGTKWLNKSMLKLSCRLMNARGIIEMSSVQHNHALSFKRNTASFPVVILFLFLLSILQVRSCKFDDLLSSVCKFLGILGQTDLHRCATGLTCNSVVAFSTRVNFEW